MNIEKELLELVDLEYKEFHSKICPGTNNIAGIRLPILRKYAKDLLKKDYLNYLNNPLTNYQEEIMLEGMLIAYSKLDIKEKEKYLKDFIPKIGNWSCCDTVASTFKLKGTDKEEMFKFLSKYQNSKKEFEVRFMIVMFLDHYLDKEYIDRVLAIIDNIKSDYYYINMAISWLLSFVYIKDKDTFNKYIKVSKLDKEVIRKGYTKIIESNRISKEEKDELRKKRLSF